MKDSNNIKTKLMDRPSIRPSVSFVHPSISVHEVDGPSSKTRPLVHLKIYYLVRRLNPSMRWTVHDQKFVRSSTLKWKSWPSVRIRPWGGRSEPKFSSVVHMDGWTGGRSADGCLRPWRPGPYDIIWLVEVVSFHFEFCFFSKNFQNVWGLSWSKLEHIASPY